MPIGYAEKRRKSEWQKKKKKWNNKTWQLWFKQRETNSTGFAYTCTLKNNTVALNNSRNQPTVRLIPWETNILVLNYEKRDDKGKGRRERKRRRESNIKSKDCLGDNEWCKLDDLLASAVRSHSHTWSLFFFPLLFSPSPSTSLSAWPNRLIITEKRFIFVDQNVSVTSYNGVEGVCNSKAVE